MAKRSSRTKAAPAPVPAAAQAGSGLGVSTLTRKMPIAADRARGVAVGQVVVLRGKDVAPTSIKVTAVDGNGRIDAEVAAGEVVSGLFHKSVLDQTPADDPARNQPYWDFAS